MLFRFQRATQYSKIIYKVNNTERIAPAWITYMDINYESICEYSL